MNDSILIQKIKKLRKQYGYSQSALSKQLHLSRAAYANYEASKRQISAEILVSIARFYQVSLDSLLREEFDTPLPFPLLSEDIIQLLGAYCVLSSFSRKKALNYLSHLSMQDKSDDLISNQ